MSNLFSEAKDATMHKHHEQPSQSSNAGPHDSNVANKLDPRVDSDRDNRAAGSSAGYNDNPRSTNAGPHESNLANKVDARIDNDQSQRGAIAERNPPSTNYGPSGSNLVDSHGNRGQYGS